MFIFLVEFQNNSNINSDQGRFKALANWTRVSGGLHLVLDLASIRSLSCRPTGIEVSDADYGALGTGSGKTERKKRGNGTRERARKKTRAGRIGKRSKEDHGVLDRDADQES
ncbi:hypothetical protein TNCV_1311021 [Trichonephila clavipes]|nr:hypothetical protein TNCV_1311021 [Trichonephila clavipes]